MKTILPKDLASIQDKFRFWDGKSWRTITFYNPIKFK